MYIQALIASHLVGLGFSGGLGGVSSVAPVVAAFPLYQRPLFEHLVYVKLRHWDISVRELSARALAALAPTNPSFVAGAECLDVLVAATLSADLPTRHGTLSWPPPRRSRRQRSAQQSRGVLNRWLSACLYPEVRSALATPLRFLKICGHLVGIRMVLGER